MRGTWWIGLLCACAGDKDSGDTGEPPDFADADTDSDTDTDADADADADSDADTDTGTPGEPDCLDLPPDPIAAVDWEQVLEAKYCWTWEQICGFGTCPGLPGTVPDCPVDPKAACACLDATFTCGAYTVAAAPSCGQVLDCWTIETAETADSSDSAHTGDSGDSGGSGAAFGPGQPIPVGANPTVRASEDSGGCGSGSRGTAPILAALALMLAARRER